MAKSPSIRLVIECLLVAVLGYVTWQFYFKAENKPSKPEEAETERDLKSSKFIKDRSKLQPASSTRDTRPVQERLVDRSVADAGPEESVEPPVVEEGILAGVVVDEDGNPASGPVAVFDKEGAFSLETITGEFRQTLPPGRYMVIARGPDTGFGDQSEDQVEAVLISGETLSIQLVLPAAPVGELGLDFQKRNDWIKVLAVWDGGPAQQAGIQPGDLIIEIGGTPVRELNRRAIVDLLLGSPGSQVEIVMAVAEGAGWVDVPITLTREILNP